MSCRVLNALPMWCRAWEMPGIARCDINGDVMCKAGNDTGGAASVNMFWIPCVRAAGGNQNLTGNLRQRRIWASGAPKC